MPKRLPLSHISPNASSIPIQIPRISINSPKEDDFVDEVFDQSEKENLNPALGREVLFPSFGTSPSKAYFIDSPLRKFSKNLMEDSKIKKLGKGSFGTVLLGSWRGNIISDLLRTTEG